ncbi:hypothetical protein V8E36_001419 [Tilletia maclaganii]
MKSSSLIGVLATLFLTTSATVSASSSSHYFPSAHEELAARHHHLASRQDRASAVANARLDAEKRSSSTTPTQARRSTSAQGPAPGRRAINGDFAQTGFDYATQKVRGVNLGNWLVLEPWMDSNASRVLNANAVNAPSPTAIVDEYTMGQYIDAQWMTQFFTEHFDSWITEDDFRQISAAGLNHVRIPIGHWAFADCIEDNAPYQPLDRFERLKQGVMWAKKYNLLVWIDLHGTPGSQNSYPGSGHSTAGANWANNATYYELTQRAFNYLVAEFTQDIYNGTVTAIQPVNEPIGAYQKNIQAMLNKYYPWAWDALAYPNGTDAPPSNVMLTTHDGWQGLAYWQNFFNTTQARRVIMDAHPYFVYDSDSQTSADSERLQKVCAYGPNIRTSMNFYPTVAGEWSIGAPRGDNVVALRDLPDSNAVQFSVGTSGSVKAPFSLKYMQFLAVNFRAQQQIFEDGSGWLFWSWIHKAFADQSYKAGLQYGWLPANAEELDQQPYGVLCDGTQFTFRGTNGQIIKGGASAGVKVSSAAGLLVGVAVAAVGGASFFLA